MLNYTEVDSHGMLVWAPRTKVQGLWGAGTIAGGGVWPARIAKAAGWEN
jgi:hypothetical protein